MIGGRCAKAWPGRYTGGSTPPPSPRPVVLLRTSSLYSLCRQLERHLPSVQGRLQRGLALWQLICGTGLASRPALLAPHYLPADRRPPGARADVEGRPGDVLGGGRSLRAGPPARPGAEGPPGLVDRYPAGRDRYGPVCLPPLNRAGLSGPEAGRLAVGAHALARPRARGSAPAGTDRGHFAGGHLRPPPAQADPDSLLSRRFSLLRQGAACLRCLLVRNRLWSRVRLTPLPGPDWAGDPKHDQGAAPLALAKGHRILTFGGHEVLVHRMG